MGYAAAFCTAIEANRPTNQQWADEPAGQTPAVACVSAPATAGKCAGCGTAGCEEELPAGGLSSRQIQVHFLDWQVDNVGLHLLKRHCVRGEARGRRGVA